MTESEHCYKAEAKITESDGPRPLVDVGEIDLDVECSAITQSQGQVAVENLPATAQHDKARPETAENISDLSELAPLTSADLPACLLPGGEVTDKVYEEEAIP